MTFLKFLLAMLTHPTWGELESARFEREVESCL